MKNEWKPSNPDEYDLCYSHCGDIEKEQGCIGHLRGDFADGPLYTTWWPRDHALQTKAFEQELNQLVKSLRGSMLRDLKSLCQWCDQHPEARLPQQYDKGSFAFTYETQCYKYALRLSETGYHVYLYAYDKQEMQQQPKQSQPAIGGMSMA